MKTNDIGLHIPAREELYRHYGGEIYIEDFNTAYPSEHNSCYSPIALQIEVDRLWEENVIKKRTKENVVYEEIRQDWFWD